MRIAPFRQLRDSPTPRAVTGFTAVEAAGSSYMSISGSCTKARAIPARQTSLREIGGFAAVLLQRSKTPGPAPLCQPRSSPAARQRCSIASAASRTAAHSVLEIASHCRAGLSTERASPLRWRQVPFAFTRSMAASLSIGTDCLAPLSSRFHGPVQTFQEGGFSGSRTSFQLLHLHSSLAVGTAWRYPIASHAGLAERFRR